MSQMWRKKIAKGKPGNELRAQNRPESHGASFDLPLRIGSPDQVETFTHGQPALCGDAQFPTLPLPEFQFVRVG
jgi:hypothetical protein